MDKDREELVKIIVKYCVKPKSVNYTGCIDAILAWHEKKRDKALKELLKIVGEKDI